MTEQTVKVWDSLVRLFHWSLAICFTIIAIHIPWVLYANHKHKENLVRSMITGNERAASW